MSAQPLRIVAIVQARMGSSRLQGKTMALLHGRPVVAHVADRVRAAQRVDEVVFALPEGAKDDRLAALLENELGYRVYRGSEEDVLSRFYHCAQMAKADVVVRITADDPLKDPRIIDQAVELLLAHPEWAYVSNTLQPTYPEGLDIEVFRFSALEKAWHEAKLPSEREHVTPYLWKNPTLFTAHCFKYPRDLSSWRWTLDTARDFEFISKIYDAFYSKDPLFHYEDVIAYLEENPFLREINADTIRNEGYLKSLSKEKATDART